jgi:hypothetical protein
VDGRYTTDVVVASGQVLDGGYRPEPYFIADYAISGVTLTPERPVAVVWTAPVASAH